MKYVYLFGGAIGDSLVGIHLGRVLAQARPHSRLVLLSTRHNPFVQELAAQLPFLRYYEFSKTDPRTWWVGIFLIASPSSICVFEPSDVPVPPWWQFTLRLATWFPGSKEVHSQIIGHERPVARSVQVLTVTPDDNLFTINVPRILKAWGIEVNDPVPPSLPRPACETPERPYILFHFFAGNYRRSFPVEKARPVLEAARILYPNYEFVLTATPVEKERALRMADGIADVRIEAELSASELLCELSNAALIVGVASGVTHLSSHLGVPTVALANLSDPYWLPTYAANTLLVANKGECRCQGNKVGDCTEHTPEGDVFRCIYFISTEMLISGMKEKLAP